MDSPAAGGETAESVWKFSSRFLPHLFYFFSDLLFEQHRENIFEHLGLCLCRKSRASVGMYSSVRYGEPPMSFAGDLLEKMTVF